MNKRNIFFIIVLLLILGVGFFLYQQNAVKNLGQEGEFSASVRNLPLAKQSEVVELKDGDAYSLTASVIKKAIKGTDVKMLAYNGSIPGPLIKVPQGAEITLNFKNETDVDSTIHSHGVRVENQFDGVPDVTQKAVKPGGSFVYTITFPDAGMFWYHPHLREDYAQELGLYGNFLVVPKEKDYWAEVDREEALFVDDLLIEDLPAGRQGGQIAPFSRATVDHALMGRFGNVMLVNGDDKYRLAVKQGERVRFYITNAANTRVFNLSIPNARMKLVGADNGKYEREEWVDSVVLSPSERAIVEIWFDTAGDYQIIHKTPEKTYTMGTIAVSKRPVTVSYFLIPRVNQDVINSLNPLRPLFGKLPDKELSLSIDMSGMMEGEGHMMPDGSTMQNSDMMMGGNDEEKIEWEDDMAMMNSMATNKTAKWKFIDTATKKENRDIDWQFQKGEKVKLRLFNDPKSQHPMQHPIHLHGQRFLILATNDVPTANLVFKDTVLVQKGDTVDIFVEMENPGKWLIHCHIPEHMEAGMMLGFTVN